MVSKTLLAKGFVALSTSSAIGTGALKFFSTKDLSERVNEELKRRFKEKTNRQVLEIAGFTDASTDRNILRKSLELRLTSAKVKDELINKLVDFCKEGMDASFEGITDVYKTLATVCSRTILLESKVQRDNLRLSKRGDVSEKLSQITDKHRERKFIKSLSKETAEELIKACEKFGSRDVFSYLVSSEELADYMTFCVEEKPSTIRFWTGVENPSDIVDYWTRVEEEERQAREKRESEEKEQQKLEEEKRVAVQKLADQEAEKQRQIEAKRQSVLAEEKRKLEEQQAAADLKAKQDALREQQEAEQRKAKEDAERQAQQERDEKEKREKEAALRAKQQQEEEARRQALEEEQRKRDKQKAADLQEEQEEEAKAKKVALEEENKWNQEERRLKSYQKRQFSQEAKQKLLSLGFKVNELDKDCKDKLHRFKEGNNLREMVKVCYKNKKFSDRAKDLGLGAFEAWTNLTPLENWWKAAKEKVSLIIPGVEASDSWDHVKIRVRSYCESSEINKEVNSKFINLDWKDYLTACTMEGNLYEKSTNSKAKKVREKGFWTYS